VRRSAANSGKMDKPIASSNGMVLSAAWIRQPRRACCGRLKIVPILPGRVTEVLASSRRSVVHRSGVERAEAVGCASEKKSLHATERDTEANRRRREEFVERIRSVPPEHLIFLDESGVTTSMTRLYGRRVDGRRIHESTPGGSWKILTILARCAWAESMRR